MAAPPAVQHVFPTPHASQGQALHSGGAKYPRQLPPAHTWVLAHAFPQVPQFRGSPSIWAGVKQAPAHDVRPITVQSSVWQIPSMHAPPQAAPHAPHWLTSAVSSTQAPPHRVRPGRQAQVPPEQTSVSAQAVPQAPQFFGLLARLTHAPPQICPPGQPHAPAWQLAPWAQAWLQPPQLPGSAVVSTQLPEQRTCPEAQ